MNEVTITLDKYDSMRDRILELESMLKELQKGSENSCIERNYWTGTEIRIVNTTGLIEKLKAEADNHKDRCTSWMNKKLPFICIGGKTVQKQFE